MSPKIAKPCESSRISDERKCVLKLGGQRGHGWHIRSLLSETERWRITSNSESCLAARRFLGKRKRSSLMMRGRMASLLPADILQRLYFGEKLPTTVIAKRYGVAQSSVYRLFDRYGFRTRTLEEAMFLRRKPLTRYKRLRKRVLDMMGGKCAHCGCTDSRVLELHHIKGGGNRETKAIGGGAFWYNIAMGRRSTADLEICCRPCHAVEEVKRVYNVDSFQVVWRGS